MTPLETAAAWMAKAEHGRMSARDKQRLEQWLAEDPAHLAAWETLRKAMEAVASHAAQPPILAHRVRALSMRSPQRSWPHLPTVALIAATLVMGVLFWGLSTRFSAHAPAFDHYTSVGERQTVPLPDGSSVTLDTDSRIEVAYSGTERAVRLIRGQALFEVAKNPALPFRVYAGDRVVTAVGTKFNVRLNGEGAAAEVKVALLEGVVKVRKTEGGLFTARAHEVTMAAGELMDAPAQAPMRVATADVERVASWRTGIVSFDDQPLESVIAEMNRYSPKPVRLADARFAQARISGSYRTGDAERFAATIADLLPLSVEHAGDGAPILTGRE